MNMAIVFLIAFIIIILITLIWAINASIKQSESDWSICNDLKNRAELVKTKDEILALHKELCEKSKTIYNKYVIAELNKTEAYLRGLYAQYKKEK